MVQVLSRRSVGTVSLPDSFDDWRNQVRQTGSLPIIPIAGSRGKSTVVRLLDAIFNAAGLRTVTWTNTGVEVRGRRQRGELAPWSRALARLGAGTLDVAIQELDWSTVHAVGLPMGVYPLGAVTNVCGNNDSCLIHGEARRAMAALPSVLHAVGPAGVLVLNGEDYAVAGEEVEHAASSILIAQSRETPLLRAHLRAGGTAVWINGDAITSGTATDAVSLASPRALPLALGGAAAFQLQNAMIASAVAMSCGIPATTIIEVLTSFVPDPVVLPGSFNVIAIAESTAIVDRPHPSWFLRPVLRAIRDLELNRIVTIVGRLESVHDDDLAEVGRLLGRISTALILHSEGERPNRDQILRQGIALNDVPPLIIHTPTERRALNRSLKMMRARDALFVLADQPAAVVRAVTRAAEGGASSSADEADDRDGLWSN